MRSHLLEFKLGSRQPVEVIGTGILTAPLHPHVEQYSRAQYIQKMVGRTIEVNISSLQYT